MAATKGASGGARPSRIAPNMLFKDFAEQWTKIEEVKASDRRREFVSFWRRFFPWPESQTITGSALSVYTDHLRFLSSRPSGSTSLLHEYVAAIYLCQGRIGLPYLACRPKPEHGSNVFTDITQVKVAPRDLSLTEVYARLNGQAAAIEIWLDGKRQMPEAVRELASYAASAVERRVLARILTGPWIADELLIAVLSAHPQLGRGSNQTLTKIYRTTLPDLGLLARRLWRGGFGRLMESVPLPGLPLKPEKIGRLDNVIQAWQKAGACFVQPKYDGWQVQIHKADDQVWLFGRGQEDLTQYFPDVVLACQQHLKANSTALDCEIIGLVPETGRLLPLDKVRATSVNRAIVFDVLMINGKDWRGEQYTKRRKALTNLLPIGESATLCAVEEAHATSLDMLKSLFDNWVSNDRYEGIIVKRLDGQYRSAGQSNGKWKVKNYFSLDLVIVGYRIATNDIPMFLACVWDNNRQHLIPVGEIWSTKSPQSARELLEICMNLRLSGRPDLVVKDIAPKVWIEPKIIVEVRMGGVRVSDKRFTHAEYTRFRDNGAFRLRLDNATIEDADTLSEFFELRLAPGEQNLSVPSS